MKHAKNKLPKWQFRVIINIEVINMKLCDSLKRFREAKNIKQKVIANSLGISASTYNRYEKGEREPNIEMIIKIAKFYCLPVQALFLDYSTQLQYESLQLGELGTLFQVKLNQILKTQSAIIESRYSDANLEDNRTAILIKEYKENELELRNIVIAINEVLEQSISTIEDNKYKSPLIPK